MGDIILTIAKFRVTIYRCICALMGDFALSYVNFAQKYNVFAAKDPFSQQVAQYVRR